MRMWEEVFGVKHLLITVSLYGFANAMVLPAIIDVTMAALCPGKHECSLAIYITGVKQAIMGLGSVVVMPMIGTLSDTYGRKAMITLPMILSIFPLAILAYSRKKYYFHTYNVVNTVFTLTTQGSVQFLAFAYVADNVEERKRGSVFGILSGLSSSSYLLGTLSSRFLSISATFQVAVVMSIIALLYMRVFLRESILENSSTEEADCLLQKPSSKPFNILPSLIDTICMLRTSPKISKVGIVALLSTVADVGQSASLMYYLKARFYFNKDEFADLMIISGIAGSISQLLLMPILTPHLGEEKMLSIGLFFSCAQAILFSFAWSSWVAYAATMICILSNFTQPCLSVIASKLSAPTDQGKVQGCITGVCSFANIVTPLAFTPLTALFLSENTPFYFPGFSSLCASFVAMAALAQSIALRQLAPPPVETCSIINNNHVETLV